MVSPSLVVVTCLALLTDIAVSGLKKCSRGTEYHCQNSKECFIFYTYDIPFMLCYNELCHNSSYVALKYDFQIWATLIEKEGSKVYVRNGFIILENYDWTKKWYKQWDTNKVWKAVKDIRDHLDERKNVPCKDPATTTAATTTTPTTTPTTTTKSTPESTEKPGTKGTGNTAAPTELEKPGTKDTGNTAAAGTVGPTIDGGEDGDGDKGTTKPGGESGKGTTQPGGGGGNGTKQPATTNGGSDDWFPDLGIPIQWLVVIGAVALVVVVGVCYYFCKSGEETPLPDVERGSRRRSRRSSARHSIDSRHSMASRQSMGRSMPSRPTMNAPSSGYYSYGTPTTQQSMSRASSASRKKSSTSRGSSRYRSSSYY